MTLTLSQQRRMLIDELVYLEKEGDELIEKANRNWVLYEAAKQYLEIIETRIAIAEKKGASND